jgi:hypothetical protein
MEAGARGCTPSCSRARGSTHPLGDAAPPPRPHTPPLPNPKQASRVVAGGAPHLSADIGPKLAYYSACGADEAFPEFTGGLVTGRYSRDGFCPEEARQRHGDIVGRLAEVLGLCGGMG